MQQKWDQGSLRTQRLTLIGSRTHLGPLMDPGTALKCTQHGRYILAIPALVLDWETSAW